MSPTRRTLERLRADGWMAAVVERWNPHAGVRQDLWGILDILAVRGSETLGIQVTTATNLSKRVRKLADSPALPALRKANWTLQVWGWRKRGGRWEPRIVDVS